MQEPHSDCFRCNNDRCRRDLPGKSKCYLTNCFHIFCSACRDTLTDSCPACGSQHVRSVLISINAKHANADIRMIGFGSDEIIGAAYNAMRFLTTQQTVEQRRVAVERQECQAKCEVVARQIRQFRSECEKLNAENQRLLGQNRSLYKQVSRHSSAERLTPARNASDFFLDTSVATREHTHVRHRPASPLLNLAGQRMTPTAMEDALPRPDRQEQFVTPRTTSFMMSHTYANISGSCMKSEFVSRSGRCLPH